MISWCYTCSKDLELNRFIFIAGLTSADHALSMCILQYLWFDTNLWTFEILCLEWLLNFFSVLQISISLKTLCGNFSNQENGRKYSFKQLAVVSWYHIPCIIFNNNLSREQQSVKNVLQNPDKMVIPGVL